MSSWAPVTGATLLIPSGPSGEHLFVVVFGPSVIADYGKASQFISVGVTTLHPNLPHDPACVLSPGDHPFIKHPSYLAYRHARVDSGAHLTNQVKSGVFRTHEPLDPEVLRNVASGVGRSAQVRREIKKIMGFI